MTTTRIYRSTDTSAPVLVGGASSLINLLDKCLVAGYGSKTAAGWTKPFIGTNKAAFRNSLAAGGTGMYLRVDDSASATGAERSALCRVHSTMSDVDTGSDMTPSVAQAANATVWRKSDTIDATVRAWQLIADERTMYLCVQTGTSSIGDGFYGAGDIASDVAGDGYAFMVFGRSTPTVGGSNGESGSTGPFVRSDQYATPTPSLHGWLWVARGYAGTAGAVRYAVAMLGHVSSGSFEVIGGSSAGIAASSPGGGNVYWQPAILAAEATLRGTMRGLHMPLNSLSGVAAGINYAGATGRPAGSVLTVARNFCTFGGAESSADGHYAVESALEW